MVTALLCTSGAGPTDASAYFTNRTTGTTTSLSFTAPAGTSLTGNSAEWVVEAPTVGGQQSAMAESPYPAGLTAALGPQPAVVRVKEQFVGPSKGSRCPALSNPAAGIWC